MSKVNRRTNRASSKASLSSCDDSSCSVNISPAYKSTPTIVIFLLAATAGVVADLLSKHYVFGALIDRPERSVTLIDGLLKFTLSTNPGIVFGFRHVPSLAVLGITMVAVVAVIILFATSPRRQWCLHAALSMVIAGALGNAYDRLFSRVTFPGRETCVGHVRDFIDVNIFGYRYPVFNVADIFLVVGVGLILIETIRHRNVERSSNP